MTVFLIIALVLLVVLLLPIGASAEYSSEGLAAAVKIASFNIDVYPPKKTTKPKKEKVKKKKDEPSKKGGSFELLKSFLPEAIKLLDSVRRGIVINELTVHLTSFSDDPYKAAMGFGRINAAIGMLTGLIESAFTVKKRNFTSSFSFEDKENTVYLKAVVTIRIITLLKIAAIHGPKLLDLYSDYTKKMKVGKAEK